MKIGIDMRMANTGEGIGRYVEELVRHLAEVDNENDYYLLIDRTQVIAGKPSITNPKFRWVEVESRYYSWKEQTYFVWELLRLKLDIMHFASFNVPIFYPGKFAVTIHDVIHHQYPGRKKSRFLQRLAYRLVIGTAVKRAKKIIAVSHATKNDIVKTFGVDEKKVTVIYEGAPDRFENAANPEDVLARHNITKPFLLFVGVWRQYKNLPRLATAFDILRERYKIDGELVCAGKIDQFYPEIRQAVFGIKNHREVRALGFVSDEDLAVLYKKAKVFILPSLTEGFGLAAIEAQAVGVPVAVSDIPVLREILGSGAVYFDPNDPENMAQKFFEIWKDENSALDLGRKAMTNARRFAWKNCARETLELYKSLV